MDTINNIQQSFERNTQQWMQRNGFTLLRVSIGVVFFWFGIIKFFPALSPAQDLAARTITQLTFGLLTPTVAVVILATWECLIGFGFIVGKFQKATLLLMFLQMIGTFTPVFLFPNEVFSAFPYAPTLEGQYIIKNIVIVSAGFVLGARVFGKK